MEDGEPGAAIVAVEDAQAVPAPGPAPDEALRRRLVLVRSALLTGLCRFVPVPFLDDYLEAKVRHFMVASLLRRAGRTYGPGHLAPLWEGADGCLDGCVGFVLKLPWTLTVRLLKKLFKTALVLLVIREAAVHVGETLLLGRVVERALAGGAFPEGAQHEPGLVLREEARLVRRAFDRAFAGTDMRLLRQAIEEVLERTKELPRAGARAVRAMFGGRRTDAESPRDLPESERTVVDGGVGEVDAALERPELASFLESFDLRFDDALRELRRPRLPGPAS